MPKKKTPKKTPKKATKSTKRKALPKPPPPVRISVCLDQNIVDRLDREIRDIMARYPGVHPTRSSVARAIVSRSTVKWAGNKEERMEAYATVRKESSVLKLQAMKANSFGDGEVARQIYLMAAMRELEALSILRSPTEATVLTAVTEIVGCLKAATGYRSLPNVPVFRA